MENPDSGWVGAGKTIDHDGIFDHWKYMETVTSEIVYVGF